jgi:drug/metabolite transporter (DMT)-like permease
MSKKSSLMGCGIILLILSLVVLIIIAELFHDADNIGVISIVVCVIGLIGFWLFNRGVKD